MYVKKQEYKEGKKQRRGDRLCWGVNVHVCSFYEIDVVCLAPFDFGQNVL